MTIISITNIKERNSKKEKYNHRKEIDYTNEGSVLSIN